MTHKKQKAASIRMRLFEFVQPGRSRLNDYEGILEFKGSGFTILVSWFSFGWISAFGWFFRFGLVSSGLDLVS